MNFKAIPLFSNTDEPRDLVLFHAAMILLYKKASGYHTMLVGLPSIIWTRGVKTAATCGFYIYVNPDFFAGLANHLQRAFLLAHEASHILLQHMPREKRYTKRGFFRKAWDKLTGKIKKIPLIHKLWNKAADLVINADLIAHGLEAPERALLDQRFDRDAVVDTVYQTLFEEQPEPEDEQDDRTAGDDESDESQAGDESTDDKSESSDESGDDDSDESGEGSPDGSEGDDDAGEGTGEGEGDESSDDASGDGSGTGSGTPQPTEHDGHDEHFEPQYEGTEAEQEEALEEDRAKVRTIVDQAIDGLEQARERGEYQAGTSSPFADAGYRHSGEGEISNVPWDVELANLMIKSGRGGDLSYARINATKLITMGVVIPRHKGVMNRMVWTVDVSGSVDRYMLGRAMILVAEAIDAMHPVNGCLVLFTNTKVIEDHEVHTGADLLALDIPNCGGTKMMAAVNYLEEYGITDHDVHLCFTDGELPYGEWQQLADNDVIVVLDRKPSWHRLAQIKASGIRYIVAEDDAI